MAKGAAALPASGGSTLPASSSSSSSTLTSSSSSSSTLPASGSSTLSASSSSSSSSSVAKRVLRSNTVDDVIEVERWKFSPPIRDSSESQRIHVETRRQYSFDGLAVRDTGDSRGRGVYATKDLRDFPLLIPNLVFPVEDGATPATLSHVWEYTDKLASLGRGDGKPKVDCELDMKRGAMGGLAITSMINEPLIWEKINCIFWGNCVRTLRPIEKGEQLLVYYGKDYHRTWDLNYAFSVAKGPQVQTGGLPRLDIVASFVRHYYDKEVISYYTRIDRPGDAQTHWTVPSPALRVAQPPEESSFLTLFKTALVRFVEYHQQVVMAADCAMANAKKKNKQVRMWPEGPNDYKIWMEAVEASQQSSFVEGSVAGGYNIKVAKSSLRRRIVPKTRPKLKIETQLENATPGRTKKSKKKHQAYVYVDPTDTYCFEIARNDIVRFLLANLAVEASKIDIDINDLVHPLLEEALMETDYGVKLFKAMSSKIIGTDGETFTPYAALETKFSTVPAEMFRKIDAFLNVNMHEQLVLDGATRNGQTDLRMLTRRVLSCNVMGGLKHTPTTPTPTAQANPPSTTTTATIKGCLLSFMQYERTDAGNIKLNSKFPPTTTPPVVIEAVTEQAQINAMANNERMERYVSFLARTGRGGELCSIWSAAMKRIGDSFKHAQDSLAIVEACENLGEANRFHAHVDAHWSNSAAKVIEKRRESAKYEAMLAIVVQDTQTHTHTLHVTQKRNTYIHTHTQGKDDEHYLHKTCAKCGKSIDFRNFGEMASKELDANGNRIKKVRRTCMECMGHSVKANRDLKQKESMLLLPDNLREDMANDSTLR